ncbi:uncharacterized protein At5g65660-like [Prunus avium]|uniref:Uncharacterized protein At5g65660-like n=1 Tax=Prunus avium TaxID=42229 RepID=A0A6P5TWK9_PRUAV|nr:uncharacterized protein At5g65660-like [Prunus avium]
MENYEASTRPNLAFPVGLALLLFLLLSISAFFLCCLHWDRLRALIFSSVEDNPADQIEPELDQKPALPNMMAKQNQQQSLPVLMPGDQVPKFIAIACPCEPPVREKLTVIVQKPAHFCDAATVYI